MRTGVALLASAATALGLGMGVQQRAVLWDIDGTLCDSYGLAFDATNRALTSNGFAATSLEEYKAYTVYTTPVRLARHAKLEPGTAEFDSVGAKLGAQFDADYTALVTPETVQVFPGLMDLIRGLDGAGARQGCLTNAAKAYADAVVGAHGLGSVFKTVHGADSVPAPKPAGDGLLLCAAELQCAPAACAYVGDSPTDGKAARAAGFGLAVGVAFDSRSAHNAAALKDHFDVVVDNVPELTDILKAFEPRQTEAA